MNILKKSRKTFALIFLPVFVFSLAIFALGIIPHYTCGCGEQIQKSSKLTHIVNRISENIIGREIL